VRQYRAMTGDVQRLKLLVEPLLATSSHALELQGMQEVRGSNPRGSTLAVWRSVRHGGDTKTAKSRRTLGLPHAAGEALREHRRRQNGEKVRAGVLWKDHGLVFATKMGTPLDAGNVRRQFKVISKAAGIGEDWTPRELRTSFVSLLSASGVPVEEIARLAGHSSSRTTEVIYRREIRPVLVKGAEVMDQLFG
jgi:integrase